LCARVHAVAARIKSADGDNALTIKSTAKHVTITQVQTASKRTPTRAKKDQAGAVNLQINIGGRSTAPLKMQKQTVQTKISHNGRKSRWKKDTSGTLATNVQQEVMSPEALSKKKKKKKKKAVATHHADHRVRNEEYDHPYYGEHDLDQRPVWEP